MGVRVGGAMFVLAFGLAAPTVHAQSRTWDYQGAGQWTQQRKELAQSRPSTDPTSWIYQANIHGVPVAGDNCPASTDPPQPAWSTCQHGSFLFLAWHRMYLYYFERILRAAIQQATGDPNYQFALPYWDYSTHQLPDSFRTPAAPSNPLYVAERRTSCNSPQGSQQCVSDAQGSSAQAMTLFPFCNCPAGQPSCDGCVAGLSPDETFGGEFTPQPEHFLGQFGELELQPHNVIHNRVGGPTGWMSDPDCAARDPICQRGETESRQMRRGSSRARLNPFRYSSAARLSVSMCGGRLRRCSTCRSRLRTPNVRWARMCSPPWSRPAATTECAGAWFP